MKRMTYEAMVGNNTSAIRYVSSRYFGNSSPGLWIGIGSSNFEWSLVVLLRRDLPTKTKSTITGLFF